MNKINYSKFLEYFHTLQQFEGSILTSGLRSLSLFEHLFSKNMYFLNPTIYFAFYLCHGKIMQLAILSVKKYFINRYLIDNSFDSLYGERIDNNSLFTFPEQVKLLL